MDEQRVVRRQDGFESDAGGQRARQGQDDAPCRHGGACSPHLDAVTPCGDARDRRPEYDGVTELGRHGVGHLPDAALNWEF